MSAFTLEASASSRAAPEAVWATLTATALWPRWNRSARWAVFEGSLSPGSFLTIQPRRGRQTAYTVEAANEPQRLTFAVRFGPLGRIGYDFRIVPEGEGSRISARLEVSGLLRAPIVRVAGRRFALDLPESLAALAQLAADEKKAWPLTATPPNDSE